VGESYRKMKGMADYLRDLGEPVADRTLVLNLLCGLSPRYGQLKALIKRTVPFPPSMPCGMSFSSKSSPWRLMHPLRPRPSTALLLEVMHFLGGPLVLCRPRPLPTLLQPSLRLLVQLPLPTEVVGPARATALVAAPPVVVPSAGVVARRDRHSTTPGPGPSPCG
jgi:hypothetical protein